MNIKGIFVFATLALALLPYHVPDTKAAGILSASVFEVSAPARNSSQSWNIQMLDAPRLFSEMGPRSLALDSHGHPHIAYGYDSLYYAYYDGSLWHYETVDNSPRVGEYTSLALDSSGTVHIAYFDSKNGDLKYARRVGGNWQVETVASDGLVGQYVSLALDSNSYPHLVYQYGGGASGSPAIRYAKWTVLGWNTQDIQTGILAEGTSIAVDQNGVPHVSYSISQGSSKMLRYARWTENGWQIQTVDTGSETTGAWSSLM